LNITIIACWIPV